MWDEFQKQTGYRLVLRRFSYPNSAKTGAMMPIASSWVNKVRAHERRAAETAGSGRVLVTWRQEP
jgi:hypothetical protein